MALITEAEAAGRWATHDLLASISRAVGADAFNEDMLQLNRRPSWSSNSQ
jgi:hypothetical protein